MRFIRFSRLSALTAVWCLIFALTASSATATGPVLPPGTQVGGYTLLEAARATVASNSAPCDASLPPSLPFRNLCAVRNVTDEGDGLLVSGRRAYTVRPNRYLFHVLSNVTDGEPVLGTYPRTRAAALSYWFDQDQVGGDRGRVWVDGVVTPLTRGHVVGPYAVNPPLSDGATHDIAMATYIAPLSVGRHRIRTEMTFDGDLVFATYGVRFFHFVDVFDITVAP